METKLRKSLILVIIFMIMFSNFGFTLEAIASSEEFQVISNGFFRKDEVKFDSYFEDSGGKQQNENISNVNERVKLKAKITPQVEGYLKKAVLQAVSADGSDLNFRFVSVKEETVEEFEVSDKTNLDTVGEEKPEFEKHEEEDNTELENEVLNEITNEVVANEINENEVEDTNTSNTVNEVSNVISNEISNTNTENNTSQETVSNEINENEITDSSDTFVDEDEFVKDIEEQEETKEILVSDVKIISDSEIELKNILKETTLEIELEFNKNEKINIADLYKEISLRLKGTYINVKLEEVEVAKEKVLKLGWQYSKDVILTSEYTKFSPFKIGEVTGIIAENKITVARNTDEEKYLPIKNMNLEVMVPTFNGSKPRTVTVQANKLMATKGQDNGFVEFSNENWTYNEDEGKIIINVNNENNGQAINSLGEDEYVIIYRFDEYTENEKVTLQKDVTVKVEEYSAKENNILTEKIAEKQEIEAVKGELITYSIGTSEEKINKGKIYANYNSDEIPYEAEYTNNIRLNILTSDMLEELKLDSSKEYFIDNNGVEIEASGIRYKRVKFNYNDIKATLEKGGSVEIYSVTGELLYTLNNELVKSEEDCIINMNNEPGIIIQVKEVSCNGKLDIELTKAIARPDLEKSIFAGFKKVESRVTAEVKYANIEETITLPTIGTAKEFEESYTKAELSINKNILTTMQENENVELKIELNNNTEKSDLYVNPTFEIVYPRYIKQVDIESINVLYENNLTIKHFETYKDEDENVLKTKIELEGTQTRFVENSITNGTNIILNTKMILDDYTPRKEDQIKLYYYNEGVSNYQTQTKWKVNKNIPANILKHSNGFDAAIVNYQTPVGLIAINGILNYDGAGTEVRSVKQGEMTRRIGMNKPAVTSTMEVIVLNNTGNQCSDITMLGRIPFKGNRDVITNEDLGTNIDVALKGLISEDADNTVKATIYYSANERANKNLNDESNGWTTEVEDLSRVKSFLIVVDGIVEPGAFLRYTYDFEIPENLPYESKLLGSFGAYYNNLTEVATIYETSNADRVMLETEAGAKVEATMTVDIGEGAEIKAARLLKYTIRVANTGSVDLKNITVENKRPAFTTLCKEKLSNDKEEEDYLETNDTERVFNIEELKAGEVFERDIVVKTSTKPKTLEDYCKEIPGIVKDEDGLYYIINENNEKIKVDSVPEDIYIENKANIKIENLAREIETNTVRNKLLDSNFDVKTELFSETEQILNAGGEAVYSIDVQNITPGNLKNVVVESKLSKEIRYKGLKEVNQEYTDEYDEENNIVRVNIGDLKPSETVRIYMEFDIANMKNVSSTIITNDITIKADNDIEEKVPTVSQKVVGPNLVVTQEINTGKDNVLECDEFQIIINVNNRGEGKSNKINFKVNMPKELKILSITSEGDRQISVSESDNIISGELVILDANRKASLIIKTRSNPLGENEKARNININTSVQEDFIGELEVNSLPLTIKDNPDRELTPEEKDEIEKDNSIKDPTASDDYKDNTQNDNNNNNANKPTDDNKNNNSDKTNVVEKTYKISGEVWNDKNNDGLKDEKEDRIGKVEVSLYKGKNQIKTCATDSLGKYRFENLKPDVYTLSFKYDSDKYSVTTYKKMNVEENMNSDVIEYAEGIAATNEIKIIDSDKQIDAGFKDKDILDFEIQKYITKAKITTKGKEKITDFEDKSLVKLEIKSKELKNTTISFEYKLIIKNTGNVDGVVGTIKDYLPKELEFKEKENKDWYLGNDGILYNESLKNASLSPGETKEIKLILNKKMTENNTGTISNKAEICNITGNNLSDSENKNNVNTQETIVTVSTGKTIQMTAFIVSVILATVVIKTSKAFDFKKMKRIYK